MTSFSDHPLRGRQPLRLAAVLLLIALLASCGGLYAGVGIAGPTVDLGPVTISSGVSLGRMVF